MNESAIQVKCIIIIGVPERTVCLNVQRGNGSDGVTVFVLAS